VKDFISMSAQASATAPLRTSTSSTPARGRRRGRATGPSIPLGSLTQRENRAAIECQACGSTRVTRLSMNLTDGTPVEFTSCHRCEHRTWEHGGDALSVDSVLDRTRRD
jgi:DNA-directed RNA polymerase subunit M/transcription elongation factor TFIIS